MDLPTDRVPDTVLAQDLIDVLPPDVLVLDAPDVLDLHREINARRAQLENPELLRRIRSL
ncbi:hypothetical protein LRS10_17450 [Phenylobacterium sp. J426]|uniref:hypothetical protein n=1 Tax=Phenylobacterium sp. J426 TaxID=2898439 RepID=UPI002150C95A|nr:hypothetical protein [Phenylobacterium sp. J426]MCR5875793.1 hypothetical protein [Phenylobacterium sp. J426]